MSDNLRDAALHYHREPQAGKIRIQATKPLSNQRDLALAYSPGVAEPCKEIEADPITAAYYTSRSNLIGVISNGTAVLGLGNIGPLASKPVMEGKAILFKNFANVDAFDIEVDQTDVDKFCDIVAALEPTFGGINLEDIKAPECFEIEAKLRERMNIPIFHDDQHGTAIVSAAAVINGLKVVDKEIQNVKLVVSGAGAAAMACTNLLVKLGLDINNIYMLDSKGVIHTERENLDEIKAKYAQNTSDRTLADALIDCDVFLGVSQPNLIDKEMLMSMAEKPLVLAMSNPDPEVKPELVYEHRPDAVMATGRSDYPNQVNNVLCFPFLFRGALDVGASEINDEMQVACVKALAELAHSESLEEVASYYKNEVLKFGPDYILPKPFDPRLITTIAPAVAQAAMDSGVATRPYASKKEYTKSLESYVYLSGNVMRPIFEKAQNNHKKVVFSDGENERILRAIQDITAEHYAFPILLGNSKSIQNKINDLGLKIKENVNFLVLPAEDDVVKQACRMVNEGMADGAITGPDTKYRDQIDIIQDVIGLKNGIETPAVMDLMLQDSGSYFITDTSVNINPTAEELANITLLAAQEIERFGMLPRVAMLSHSSFGNQPSESSEKMVEAKDLVKKLNPDLEVDGEMQGGVALNPVIRKQFDACQLSGNANLLVMPNLDAANIAFTTLKNMTNSITVGPILLGAKKPVHPLTKVTTPRGIVNLTSLVAASAD
jgi:malate dehydrogenase (oxaloacetate-decarboxylating)(NADP+)